MRFHWHILFWSIYLLVESLIVYKTGEWGHQSFWHSIVYHGSLLIPRTIFSYIFLVTILPFLTKGKPHSIIRILFVILYFAMGLFLYRAFLNKVSWPLIMGHLPDFNPFDVRLSSYSFLRLVTPLSLLLAVLSVRKEYYLKLRNEQLQKEQLRSELNYLKAQINPHFLFNSFNNLYVLAIDKSEKTAPAIEKLSSLFRYILQSSSLEEIVISDEVSVIENYVELERLRYQNIQIEFDKHIIDGSRKIPPLLMLPFIENAFKHGASEILDNGHVNINIKQGAEQLVLECRNTIETKTRKLTTESGEGIKNVTKRLDLLFPDKYTLYQGSEGCTYSVELIIPLTIDTKEE